MKRTRNLIRSTLAVLAGLVTAATAVGVTSAPAHALPQGQAYAWVTRSSGGGIASYSSVGLPVDVVHSTVGRWDVTFEGLSAPFGDLLITTGNDVPGGVCTVETSNVASWVPGRTDRSVHVDCFKGGGYADVAFTLSFTAVNGPNEGWMTTNSKTAGGVNFAYDSAGGGVWASRPFTGVYAVNYGVIGAPGGVAFATAWAYQPVHCSVIGQAALADGTESTPVVCRDDKQTPVDSFVSTHYFRNRGYFADPTLLQGYATVAAAAPAAWTTVTGANAYSSQAKAVRSWHPFTGVYQVKFDGLAGSKRMAHVNATAETASGGPCTVEATASAPAGIATVLCRDKTGTFIDEPFQVAYSARP